MVNTLGSTPHLEMYIMARAALKYATHKHKVKKLPIDVTAVAPTCLLARRDPMPGSDSCVAYSPVVTCSNTPCAMRKIAPKAYIGHHDTGA